MVEESTYAEAVTLTEPEKQPVERVSQYSVVTKAMEHHTLMNRFDSMKRSISEAGLEFGARVLLIGPPGTDFEAFSYHLCREVPLKMVRFKMEEILNEAKRGSELLRVGFEFARRNSPTVLLVERVDVIAPRNSDQASILLDEVTRTGWDRKEVLIVGTTTHPSDIDAELLSAFDRTYIIEGTSLEDRVRILEQILKGRDDIDPTVVAELTDGWSFTSVKRLAVFLFMSETSETGQIPREQIEEVIEKSGVIPLSNPRFLDSVIRRTAGTTKPPLDALSSEYPDDFLDQLYLMAVGEDYAETQRVIEVLNDGMPLSKDDREFLSKHPYLLSGNPEDRLTRLLRAKKSSDRLQRIMGR
ncbi:MAG: ATP-binding protein [Candidatus Thorarchaeota archaeon]|nr:MAG: ATP-binding protein [Candidatus Thorarchaeota archaeon]